MARPRPKELWLQLHLYLGLVLGIVFAAVGLTGSVNVYRDELDQLLHPALYALTGVEPHRSFSEVIDAARRSEPEGSTFSFVEMLATAPTTAIVGFARADGDVAKVHVDRATARVLGTRIEGESITDIAFHLHETFYIEAAGPRAAGVVGALLLSSVLSGLYIWWPKRSFADGFKVHFQGSRRRLYFELHRAIGGGGGALLVVSAFTGLFLAFPEPFLAVAGSADEAPTGNARLRSPVTIDDALAAAEKAFPGASLRHIAILGKPAATIRINMRRDGEPTLRGGESRIWIDIQTGAIERMRDPRRYSPAQKVVEWLPALHTGEALGAIGRAALFVTGLLPALLFVTGLRLWLLRRRPATRG